MFRLMLLTLLLAASAALPRTLDRGPVRTPHRPLDLANPQDENYVLRNGTLAFNFTNFGMFGNDGAASSGSLDDPCSGEWAPQFEYPEGSGAQYLFQGALWIGALIDYGDSLVPRVSVGTDGWQNPSINEFHAGEAPNNGIVLRSNLPDATDCFGNSIYDENAQANIEAVAVYSDTLSDGLFVEDDPMDGPHRPLGLQVTQTARLWTAPEYARFVILDFEIENIGENFLKNVVLGFYLDADIGMSDENNRHTDDISGSLVIDPLIGNLIGWSADNDGRIHNDPNGPIVLPDAIGVAGISESDTFGPGETVHSFNWWQSNQDPNLDYGPAWSEDPQWDCTYGTPVGDERKYHVVRNRERDYDSYEQTDPTAQADTNFWCTSDGELHEWCDVETFFEQSDTRFMLSWDAISMYDYTDGSGRCVYRLNPGERFNYSVAMFIGPDFHDEDGGEFHFDGLYESYGRAKLLYDQGYAFQPPSHPQGVRVVQAESGQIPLAWNSPAHGEIAGYRVYGRPDSGQGERVEFTTGTIFDEEFVITGLTNGDDWLIEVVSVDVQGFSSAPARQMVRVGAIPNSSLLSGVTEGGVNTLTWTASNDPTFTHYRVVRLDSTVETVFDNLTGTTLSDANVISGRTYTYTLFLHNSLDVASLPSNPVHMTPFAPANTILVYDETKTPTSIDLHNGGVSDTLVRNFYSDVLSEIGETFDYIDLSNNTPVLSLQQLAAYEMVIWHSENPAINRSANERRLRESNFEDYVAIGGKLLRIGRSSLTAIGLGPYIESAPGDLAMLRPLSLYYAFAASLRPASVPEYNVTSVGAASVDAQFPSLAWDETKMADLQFGSVTGLDFLYGVDLFWCNGNTYPLYTIDLHEADSSQYDESTICAVIGPGEIYLGFPLYFLNEDAAQDVLEAALEKLRTQELESPEPPAPLPTTIALHQNFPNPFNATTTIEFELPTQMSVDLRLYNIQGQLVRTLASGQLAAGLHRVMVNGESLASGLYFYRLQAGAEFQTRKLLLLK